MFRALLNRCHPLLLVALTLSFALTTAFLSGCSDDHSGITATGNVGPQPTTDLRFDPADAVDMMSGGGATTDFDPDGDGILHWYAYERLTPYGGEMEINDDIEFEVPAHALSAPVGISCDAYVKMVDGDVEWIQFDFQPSMTFNRVCELIVEDDFVPPACPDGTYRLWYFDEVTETWGIVAEGFEDDGDVIYEIEHFSKWAISP